MYSTNTKVLVPYFYVGFEVSVRTASLEIDERYREMCAPAVSQSKSTF